MTLRKGHGNGKGSPRIEVLPPDELPAPVPALPAPLARRENGTIADSETAKALGARGGLAKATKKRLLQGLGLANLADDHDFKKYWDSVQAWVDAQLEVAAICGGGWLGPAAASMIGSAGVALAASRFFSDVAVQKPLDSIHLFISANKMAETSRQHCLAAYELATREGKARKEALAAGAITNDLFDLAGNKEGEGG